MSKRNIVDIKPASTGLGEFGLAAHGSIILSFKRRDGSIFEYLFDKKSADKILKGSDPKHHKGTLIKVHKPSKREQQ